MIMMRPIYRDGDGDGDGDGLGLHALLIQNLVFYNNKPMIMKQTIARNARFDEDGDGTEILVY